MRGILIALVLLDLPAVASTLRAWRINQQGQLELRTPPNVQLRTFYEDGVAGRGPRVWIELPGAPERNRTIRGSGSIQEVRIDRPEAGTTRLVVEFVPGPRLNSADLHLVGTARDQWRMDLRGIDRPLALVLGEGDLEAPSSDSSGSVNDRIVTPVAISLFDLSRMLEESVEKLAAHNSVRANHIFEPGSQIVIPAGKKSMAISNLTQYHEARMQVSLPGLAGQAALDDQLVATSLTSIQAPPPMPTKGVVRLGDTLFKIAQRYGTSMQEILRLNPGLDTAKLVAGTEIQLVQAAPAPRPRGVLGLRPSSGSLSWPDAPQRLRFDQSLDELVQQGVVSPDERQRIRTGTANTALDRACRSGALSEQECNSGVVVGWRGNNNIVNQAPLLQRPGIPQVPLPSSGELEAIGVREGRGVLPLPPRLTAPSQEQNSITPVAKPLSERETALLQQIRSDASPVWRLYGKCKYDWTNWKMIGGDIRFTSADCGPSRQWAVGVSCKRLMTNIYTHRLGWQGWTKPAPPNHETRAGEDEMVAALCANLQSSKVLDGFLLS